MADKKRMDKENRVLKIYTSQREEVVDFILSGNKYCVKKKFIMEKYSEVASIFLNAYEWYFTNASKIVLPDKDSESAIWGYRDIKFIEKHKGSKILLLEVPKEEVICFSSRDFSKLINMQFIGNNLHEEEVYKNKRMSFGIKNEEDVFLTPYYPLLKRELLNSFHNLFRFNEILKKDCNFISDVQYGIWKIEREQVLEII